MARESCIQHFFQGARPLLGSHKIDQNSGLWRRGTHFSQRWLKTAQTSRISAELWLKLKTQDNETWGEQATRKANAALRAYL